MSLTLFELSHSPYCIPIRRILDAHGIRFETVAVPSWDRRELARITSGTYYQVPVLNHDGTIVHETAADPLAVAHYLDRTFVAGCLFPDHCAGLQDIIVNQIENSLEGIGFRLSDPGYSDSIQDLGERTMVIRHKERKFGAGCVELWRTTAAEIASDFESALAPYETRLAHSRYLFSEHPVYADYALLGVLGNAQYGDHYTLDSQFVHLKRWESAMLRFSAGSQDD
ncbi:MAG: glutathione S-transferase family protein [Verrucomicrobiales bacterium]